MRTRTLGVDGPEVSVVGLGCNNFGTRLDLEQTAVVIDAALDAGVTLLDTADVYGMGASEDYIGQSLGERRSQVVLATKFGYAFEGGPDGPRGARDYVMWACEQSLRRLRTDVIDLLQLHVPDPQTPIEETLRALDELVRAGTVRFIGCSNFSAEQIEEADRVARENGLARFVSVQNRYNLIERDAEAEVLPTCARLGLGFLPYFPLASGLLTGKHRRGAIAAGSRLEGREIEQEQFDRLAELERLAEERGVPVLNVAIGGLLANPTISSVIAGATKTEQVRANVEAAASEMQV